MKIINTAGKTIATINDETFEIIESNDPEFTELWNGWLENGILTIGMPTDDRDPEHVVIMEDTESKYFPGPDTLGLLFVDLNEVGLKLVN